MPKDQRYTKTGRTRPLGNTARLGQRGMLMAPAALKALAGPNALKALPAPVAKANRVKLTKAQKKLRATKDFLVDVRPSGVRKKSAIEKRLDRAMFPGDVRAALRRQISEANKSNRANIVAERQKAMGFSPGAKRR